MKNDRAISENTNHMARLAEYGREENINMGKIARATKLDSQAMKIIAIMTMLYLPATFVAVSTYRKHPSARQDPEPALLSVIFGAATTSTESD